MGVENLKGEKWKLIKGFPKYKISSYGRVLSLDFARSGEEKLLQPTKIERGYLQVCLANNGTKEKFLVHRLVAEAFIPNPKTSRKTAIRTVICPTIQWVIWNGAR